MTGIVYEKLEKNDDPAAATLLNPNTASVRVRHYFVFSLISSLLLCPTTGLIALAYSLKSSAKADVNFLDKARSYSHRALIWNLISLVLFTFSFMMTLVFVYYLNQIWEQYEKVNYDQFKGELNNRNVVSNAQIADLVRGRRYQTKVW
ncbi:unnamed protein product [Didymodactylos carnosus]|uniref:Uncharacterized protein n=1 Tax=Didymodactylos carnosus TaxID=1234261 RepID=A0A813Q2P7_9BILA|nr:unnamed protein product [Didymodactylos carnosus]CAF3541980.1 unnamed protein product [Didymodactylos carnosus]